MFCGECGTKNKKGDAFCKECGSKLESVEVTTNKTKKEVSNMRSVDDFLKSEKGLSSAWMRGANNTSLKGTTNISKLEKFTKQNFSELNPVADAMKNDILK